jgi:acyl transferase domain-containing protein/NAD(P)-dependent dehydrogenase (short-subunit alcohol dehydrogenase family)
MNKYYYPAERVAVVAMSCLLPDAVNTDILWDNILRKKVSVKEVPDHVFNKSVYYRPETFGKANKNDKTYTKVAAIPDDFDFSTLSRKYKIPPAVAAYMDINQKVAIYCVDQVVGQMKSSLPKERTAVILCTGAPGGKFENVVRRTFFSNVESHIINHPLVNGGKFPQIEQVLKDVSKEILKDTQPITEDSTTGYLQNITAGRISNIFDWWGPSYVVDGACASSLITVADSVAGLLNHEYDAVVTGGAELTISEVGFAAFSGINALSPDGSYPFDSRANGFVMGLGGGIVVLKRLSDALRDGDHIYSVISGYGLGSDGKGKYIAAPSEEGQIRVIQGACKMAGYSVDTVEMIEAHGTGTIVGDVVEVAALKKAFDGLGAQKKNYCGLGSIKSNIGHLRNAAGIAGFIKASLALYNKVLPATANIKEINPKLQLEGSPFYILTENREWGENPLHPRRANISSYGFGGADCHVCVEEFRPEFLKKSYTFYNAHKAKNTGDGTREKEEAVFFSGDSIEEVMKQCESFVEGNEGVLFEKAVYMNNLSVCSDKDWRISICACSMQQLKDKLQILEQYIREDRLKEAQLLSIKGIYIGRGPLVDSSKIAFMFPGQASQYPNMLKEMYEAYPSVRSFYTKADALWKAKYNYSVMPVIFGEDEEQLKEVLKDTRNTHPAMFISNMAIYNLLCEAGIKADYMIGHSLGEITSLYAGEMVDLKSAVNIIGERGFSFDAIHENKRGRMVSVKEKAQKVEEIIKDNGFKVSVANINSPEQTVVGGESQEIVKFADFLGKKGYKYTELNVSHAFHTDVVSKAAESFGESIKDIKFNTPGSKIMACHLTDFYNNIEEISDKMPQVLKEQILSSVNFTDSVLKLYDQGVRVFIESGPSNVLTNLVKSILTDKDVKVINVNSKSKCSVEGFKQAMAVLFAHGVRVVPVASNKVLGLQEEGCSTVVYNVESKAAETASLNNAGQSPEIGKINASDSAQFKPAAIQAVYAEQTGLKPKESIVYSGAAIGLPGTFKKAFSDHNFDYITEGRNLIESLTEEEAQRIMDLNITRLIKTEKEAVFKKISSINEVIHFAGKFGKMDMINDYLIDEKTLSLMTETVCAGVAAGYEALKDAGIPLVREYRKTASGSLLPGRLVLPSEMQDDTGIIYANGLWPLDSVISEVSRYTAAKFGASTRAEILSFFESVISRVSDNDTRKMLGDWFALYYSRLSPNPGESDIYEFNHNFMALLSSQANNRLAQFIGASGPNMYINTACASNASSVTVAEDMIRAGHARRMIVIGADISSTKNLLTWFGAAFSSIGALTESDSLFDAAVPFDNRRSGMILGSGATGLVIEKEEDVLKRGMNGICRILGTHAFNSAGHQSKIDTAKHCIELERFISKIENEYNLKRDHIASKLVYCSHETYSHKPGCSYMERASLESTFGEKFREIKVINTKGMTGHIMGASIEEAVSAKALQYQKVPPVVNYRQPDPELEGLNLSKGGAYKFEYVLRAVAAFGGQGNYHLMQRIADGDERIVDKKAYRRWIESISSPNAQLKNCGRILVAEDDIAGMTFGEIDVSETAAAAEKTVDRKAEKAHDVLTGETGSEAFKEAGTGDGWSGVGGNVYTGVNKQAITDEVLTIYSEITQYPKEMLELSMELEADLGVDTVKQATIFSMLAEKFKINLAEGQALSNYPTIGHIVELIVENSDAWSSPDVSDVNESIEDKQKEVLTGNNEDEVLKLISEITLYPVELLEKDMEMEADLGIDTVKQATIFSILRDKYKMSEEDAGNISQYRTIGSVIDLVNRNGKKERQEKEGIPAEKIVEKHNADNKAPVAPDNSKAVREQVLKLVSEITQYPVEMLEDDMEFEADLGIDTIKQATILSELGARFSVGGDVPLNPSQLKTIKSLISLAESSASGAGMVDNAGPQNNVPAEPEQEFLDKVSPNSISGSEESEFERELCVQYPIVVEEKLFKKDFDLKGKNVVILGDSPKTVKKVSGYFKKICGRVSEFVFEDASGPDELEKRLSVFTDGINDAEVILDCSHMGEPYEFEKLTGEKEKEVLSLNSVARFLFYKKLYQKKPDPSLTIVCAVSMDGCFGFAENENPVFDPFYGSLCGFYKGLGKELEKSRVKVVDLGNPKGFKLTDEVFKRLTDEIEEEFKSSEIGYTNGKRVTLKLDNLDRSVMTPVERFDANHFVVTGGGNGITAEIVLEISKRIRGKFTILGRTPLPSDIEELSNLDEGSLEEKKTEIYNRLKNEGKKATPAEVQKEHSKLIKAVSAYRLIKEIEKNGSDVLYFSCDVTDYEALKDALHYATTAYGPVNVIIHGAGIEKSRLLKDKTKEEFQEIFEVKAKGLCNLYRLADKKELKVLAGFSSISGRFGNEAQLDYCSANNFISSFMSMVKSQNKGIRAISIAWSGWKDKGMAWRNEFVKENSEEMGLHLIEPERGTTEFMNVLTSSLNLDEIVISKGLGPLTGMEKWHGIKNRTPLIDWVSKRNGEIEKVFKVLSVKADPIINHHRLGKTPLMPIVGFMEIGAEAHSLIYGKKEHYCFKNVMIGNPLKLFNEKPQEIILKPETGASGDSISVVFYNYFKPKIGKGRMIELNSMEISGNIGDYRYIEEIKNIETDGMKEVSLVDSLEELAGRHNNSIRLGPVFMDEKSKKINRFKCNDKGAVFIVALSEEQIRNKKYNLQDMLINPAFTDSLMQVCGIHSSAGNDKVYLPWKIGELGIIKVAKEPGIFTVYARLIESNDEEKTYDVILCNDKGEVDYYAKNVIVKRINQ